MGIEAPKENKDLLPEEQKAVNTIIDSKKSEVADAAKSTEEINKVEELLQYETDKLTLIKNIMNRNLNPDYNTLDPNNTEYRNKIFLTESSLQVKAYLAYYNLQAAKTNALTGTDLATINVEKFMTNFEEQKEKNLLTTGYRKELLASPVKTTQVDQEVGKFIDLGVDRETIILAGVEDIIKKGNHIDSMTLFGYADATQVTAEGATLVKEKFTSLRQSLIDSGLEEAKLPSADLLKDATIEKNQDILNQGWAYVRAMMQIAFLPKEYIKYINDNTKTFAIEIEAKPVGGTETGNQYTGGKIDMAITGPEKGTRELTETKEKLLAMIDVRTISFAYTDGKEYYTIGSAHLGNVNGELVLNNVDTFNNKNGPWSNNHKVLSVEQKGKKTFFEDNTTANTLWIMVNDPTKTDQKVKSLSEIDDRITNTGMNLISGPNDLAGFVKALEEFQNKSDADPVKSDYIDKTIDALNVYEEVDQELKAATEIKKITL